MPPSSSHNAGDAWREFEALLAQSTYLSSLDAPAREELARHALRREYAAGETVILEGEPNAGLYAIQDGWLQVSKVSPQGREQVMRVLGPGELFNVVGVFLGTPNPASVTALEDTSLWVVRREALHALVWREPSLAQAFIESLARRVLDLIGLVEDLSLRTVEARLARLLLDTASGDVVARHRWTTQARMAARLGTVLEVLNRALRALADEGLISVHRAEIRILDRAGLARRAQRDPELPTSV